MRVQSLFFDFNKRIRTQYGQIFPIPDDKVDETGDSQGFEESFRDKWGWYDTLMIVSNKDPRLMEYWVIQPATELLQYMAYIQDERSKDAIKIE